jgi:hypothetical protein
LMPRAVDLDVEQWRRARRLIVHFRNESGKQENRKGMNHRETS